MSQTRRSRALEPETRITRQPVELRAATGSARRIGGYAAVFGVQSRPLGGFKEQIDPRAFNKTAGDGWSGVMARFNHSDEMLLGTTQAGTLRLAIDNRGLDYVVDLPECRADVGELVARGDIANSSFAFQTFEDAWDYQGGVALRTLLSLRLIDVAPVAQPAYMDSTVALRSLARHVGVPIEDVVDLSAANELRKFFVRSDVRSQLGGRAPAGLTSAQLRAQLTRKRYPGGRPHVGKSAREARLTTLGKRWPQYKEAG